MDIHAAKKQIGLRLKAIRLERGLKQEDLEQWGFSYRYYGRLERGLVNPTIETLMRLCSIFQVSLIDLFDFMGQEYKNSDDHEVVAIKISEILRNGNIDEIRKLKIFLYQIL